MGHFVCLYISYIDKKFCEILGNSFLETLRTRIEFAFLRKFILKIKLPFDDTRKVESVLDKTSPLVMRIF